MAKALFLSKRARLDIAPTVAILASRVQAPKQGDWNRLVRLMRYIHSTKGWHLTLSADDLRVLKWYIDASFATHPDYKSHTGAVLTMGGGALQSLTRKQKLNSRSSTGSALTMELLKSYGQRCSWKRKDIPSRRTLSIKIIRVLFYWRLMEDPVQAKEAAR